jgi:pimeloyl-ACP methyl ester carboxylesterase/DNA-binding CsgD family transcriptional regulator
MPHQAQHIRFCRSRDGTQIATASVGSGPPLIRAAHWMSHVEHDVQSPVWKPWIAALAHDRQFIRYDQRGCGLSDRAPETMSLDAWVDDLDAVAHAYGLTRFPLLGMSQGGAIALAYAARRPEKVSRLVLFGAYGRGMRRRAISAQQREEADTLVKLIRLGWGRDNPAFRQVFTSQFIPDGTREQHQWFNDLERLSATPETAARIVETLYDIDVTAEAGKVRAPALVIHAREDARVPFEEGRHLATLIPGARFVPLDSRNHVLLDTEPAWRRFLDTFRAFMGEERGTGALAEAGLTDSERDVLALVARGIDNAAIAKTLSKSEKTVRNQVSSIFAKLGVKTRAQAIVLARDSGLGM